jgi:hypothetical protein
MRDKLQGLTTWLGNTWLGGLVRVSASAGVSYALTESSDLDPWVTVALTAVLSVLTAAANPDDTRYGIRRKGRE